MRIPEPGVDNADDKDGDGDGEDGGDGGQVEEQVE